MDFRKIGLGLGAFIGGAAALTVGAAIAGRKSFGQSTDRQPGGSMRPDLTLDQYPATEANQPDVGMSGVPHDLAKPDTTVGHVPTDLLADTPPTGRAPEAFRPDPTAVPTEEEKEALRPATGPAPSLVADEGSGFAEAAGAA